MDSSPPLPRRFCDVVMKGGITSGTVYPRAVTQLARAAILKNVGGTSAGAIAAAAAAAAELARSRGLADAGFRLLDELPDFLGRRGPDGKTNLFAFFQPQPGTRRLFHVLSAGLNCPTHARITVHIALAAIRNYWLSMACGLVPGLALLLLALTSEARPIATVAFALAALALAVAGGVAWVIADVVRDFSRGVPANFFGLCSGMFPEPSGQIPDAARAGGRDGLPLTAWLTEYLDKVAGLDPLGPPLTFGQLWGSNSSTPSAPDSSERLINLEMMTTCVTWGRPFRLPFQDEENVRNNRFYFHRDEFRRLFPDRVLAWLESHPRQSKLPQHWREAGFVPLPEPGDLPVVVATRMSLSFPVLLSAIPLYSYPEQATDADREARPPHRCWFSDGGICSNFPVHFFDAPIPRWPTFAINLADRPESTPLEELARPWMPQSNSEGIRERWASIEPRLGLLGVVRFIWAIIGTMQNWSDSTLSRLPGYRDRIAHVGLRPTEGGLNLDMPEPLIRLLCQRGAAAGDELVRRFASRDEPKMNWANHRWLRLRVLLAALEDVLLRFERTCSNPQPPDLGYELWLETTAPGEEPCYPWTDRNQRQLAIEIIHELRGLAQSLEQNKSRLETKAPRPRPELRPRPRL